VRALLQEPSAAAARDRLMVTPFGSGRHYLVADQTSAFGIEGAADQRAVIFRGDERSYAHTNHCLDNQIGAACRVAPTSTTFDRYDVLRRRLAKGPLASTEETWQLLGCQEGYPRSVCSNMSSAENPHGVATSAAVVFDHGRGEVLACAGFPHHVAPERFAL